MALEALKLNKTEFGKVVGLSPQAVSSLIHREDAGISASVAELMRVKMNLDPNWILTGEGTMFFADKPVPSKESFDFLEEYESLTEDAKRQVRELVKILPRKKK